MCRSPRISPSSTSFGSVPSAAASISPRVFAQLRRNPGEAQRFVNFFFGRAGHALVRRPTREQAVFVQREAHLQRALAQRDVVFLAAGEILQRRAVAFRAAARADPPAGLRARYLMLALFGPLPSTSCAFGCATNFSSAAGAPGPVTRRSRSPTVSFPRRRLPAGVIFSTPGDRRSRYSVSSSATSLREAQQEAALRAGDMRRWSAGLSLRASRPCAAARAASAPGRAAPDRRSMATW